MRVVTGPDPGTRQRERRVDALVVLVVLVLSVVQISGNVLADVAGESSDLDALGLALSAVMVLPLLWRRRFPWIAMGFAGAGGIALVACGYPVHIPVALIVALYGFAADSRRATWPPAVFAISLFAAQVLVEHQVLELSLEDYVLPVPLLAGAWVLGERRRTAELREAEAQDRRERERRLAIAEERTRIARELHDSAGHAINTILVQAGAARVLWERDPEKSRAAVEAIEKLSRETLDDIDRIVGSLRSAGPAELEPLPGLDRVPDLVEHQRRAGFEVTLEETSEGTRTPPPAVGRAAYRIVQESLSNAARHGSGPIELGILCGDDRMEMTVENPAPQTPQPPREGGGLGLVGMRERAQLLGGSLEAGEGNGTFRVRAVLPYDWSRP